MSTRGDFTNQAEAYSKARPGYPRDLMLSLVERTGLRSGDAVVDVGAGTGLFTAFLSERGYAVTALEPNAQMREKAPNLPGVVWRDGTFEQTGLADGSQKWAVAAQAFHWAKPELALPELRRVLARGAAFTALWNNKVMNANAVVAWTRELIQEFAPGFDEYYRAIDVRSLLASTGDFRDVALDEMLHTVPMSAERYVNLWRSHNYLTVSAGPVEMPKLLAAIEARLNDERIETVDMMYLCQAWTAVRAD